MKDIRKALETGTVIAAANADLYDGVKGLAGGVGYSAGMDLSGKISSLFLLRKIELTLINAIGNDFFAQLATRKLMQHEPLFAGVNHLTIVERCILLRKLRFFCQFRKRVQDCFVDLLSSIIISKTSSHGNGVSSDPFRTFRA